VKNRKSVYVKPVFGRKREKREVGEEKLVDFRIQQT